MRHSRSLMTLGMLMLSSLCGVAGERLVLPSLPPGVARSYRAGLDYLAATQTSAGCWEDQHGSGPGVVGLVVLAVLAGGEDPNFGAYHELVESALSYLLDQQGTNGYFGSSMYHHGFATLALAEAYGAVHDERIGPALRKAVDLILAAQERNPFGAWRYNPQSSDADTTVSGACFVALAGARNAGINVPETSFRSALEYYRSCQGPSGGFGYTNSGSPNDVRTSIGLLVYSLGGKKNTQACKNALAYLDHALVPHAGAGNHYYYGAYYKSQALFQANPRAWMKWNALHCKELISVQSKDGSWTGSNGPSFTTAAALLSMALNYRYLPIYERW